ncbi:MAG: hypothetical protein P8X60_07490 [Robiginitalea sp.]
MTQMQLRYTLVILMTGLLAGSVSCKRGPSDTGTFPLETEQNMADVHKDVVMDIHKVFVKETVPTSKYLYLKIVEGDREYWAATGNSEIKAGETYYYNEAMIQTDFESKAMQRVFDTIYLITKLVPESHGSSLEPLKKVAEPPAEAGKPNSKKKFHTSPVAGKATRLSIAELLEDPEAYEGSVVELTGVCTKINEGILGRNWLHLKDGTADDKDLVITSQDGVDPGSKITVRAVVYLNKDFGAGYAYAVLLEDGVIIP